jgi:hypothetical protein
MLKSIAIVTILVGELATTEGAYREQLDYRPVHRGRVPAAQAMLWDAPAMAGQAFVILGPASGRPVYLRFVEAPTRQAAPAAGTTHGWNAIEFLAQDPDALAPRLAPAFAVVGPPRDLWASPTAPRAMQAIGPNGELAYFTRIVPAGFARPMTPAATPVDRVFIMVVGGPSMTALQDFYGRVLGLTVSPASPFPISTLSRALGLPATTTYPLATAALARDFLVELDEYPAAARPRPVSPGALPPGVAMVSFLVADLATVPAQFRSPPATLAEFPYSGRSAAVTVGPAGEWVELIAAGSAPASH